MSRSEFPANLALQAAPGAYEVREDASIPLRVGATFRKPGASEVRPVRQPVRPLFAFALTFTVSLAGFALVVSAFV